MAVPKALLADVRQFILEAQQRVARLVDSGLTLLYWQIGERIRREVLGHKRAGYGEQIVSALARQLEAELGRGFSEKSLRHMIRFAKAFPDIQIVSVFSDMTLIYAKAGACVGRDTLGHDRAGRFRRAIGFVEGFPNEAPSHAT